MASTGIQRKIDDLGRIVIPVGVRRNLGIEEGDKLEVTVEDDRIILTKPQDKCLVCNARDELVTLKGRSVCATCLDDLDDARSEFAQVVVLDDPVASASDW